MSVGTKTTCVFFLMSACLFSCTHQYGKGSTAAKSQYSTQTKEKITNLNDVVGDFSLHEKNILDFLIYSSDTPWYFSLNSGIVIAPASIEHPLLNINLASATIAGVFDALTSRDGTYRWVYDGKVINFLPRVQNWHGLDVNAALDLTVKHFRVRNASLHQAKCELLLQLEKQGITDFLFPHMCNSTRKKASNHDSTSAPRLLYPTFSLSLRNKSVRECLNAMLAEVSPAYWMAEEKNKKIWITEGYHNGGFSVYDPQREKLYRERDQVMSRLEPLAAKESNRTISAREIKKLRKLWKRLEFLEKILWRQN